MSPKARETLYLIGTMIPAIVGILVMWTGVAQEGADNLAQVVTGCLQMTPEL